MVQHADRWRRVRTQAVLSSRRAAERQACVRYRRQPKHAPLSAILAADSFFRRTAQCELRAAAATGAARTGAGYSGIVPERQPSYLQRSPGARAERNAALAGAPGGGIH